MLHKELLRKLQGWLAKQRETRAARTGHSHAQEIHLLECTWDGYCKQGFREQTWREGYGWEDSQPEAGACMPTPPSEPTVNSHASRSGLPTAASSFLCSQGAAQRSRGAVRAWPCPYRKVGLNLTQSPGPEQFRKLG